MTTPSHDPWREWLDAEEASREDLAEQAFARLMADLPGEEPSAAFIEQVAVGAWERQVRRRRLAWAARVAVAVSVVAGGAAGVALLGSALVARGAAGLTQLVGVAMWFLDTVASGLRWWAFLGNVGSAVGTAVATPQSTVVLLALALTGAMAMAGIRRLLGDEPAQEEAHV